jgi:hypothetical protein
MAERRLLALEEMQAQAQGVQGASEEGAPLDLGSAGGGAVNLDAVPDAAGGSALDPWMGLMGQGLLHAGGVGFGLGPQGLCGRNGMSALGSSHIWHGSRLL